MNDRPPQHAFIGQHYPNEKRAAPELFAYDAYPSGHPYDWEPAGRGTHADDNLDFHVDLGAGHLRKGRIAVDRWATPDVDVVVDLEQAWLPFADSSIESMVSHHALEHIGPGFIALMDECWRVLKHDAPFRIIVPLFPGSTALGDPDHKRVFQEETFDRLCVVHTDGFAEPWSRAVWRETHRDRTKMPHPSLLWGPEGNREIRVTLRPVKE
jgi:SAM-dependent methyltransferase